MRFPHIISGGRTGADRAALDWAIAKGIPHGGWCPKGRKAEDGRTSEEYQLQETVSADYPERTERNVIDTDGTVIFTLAPKPGRGSRLTIRLAERYGKPWLHLHTETSEPATMLASFIQGHRLSLLNVAGSRASKEPGIGHFVHEILTQTASFLPDHDA